HLADGMGGRWLLSMAVDELHSLMDSRDANWITHFRQQEPTSAAAVALLNLTWCDEHDRDDSIPELVQSSRYAGVIDFTLASILRDLFGPLPVRLVAFDPAWLTWNDGTVAKVAQHIYEQRRFSLLPILCDALEEAGCGDPDIIRHCRLPGEHARGCWVVDALL